MPGRREAIMWECRNIGLGVNPASDDLCSSAKSDFGEEFLLRKPFDDGIILEGGPTNKHKINPKMVFRSVKEVRIIGNRSESIACLNGKR